MKICTVLEQRREALRAEYPFWTKKTLYDHPYLAEAVLSSGKADFVTMLRASLADPELPNIIRDGRIDEINYCIGCLQGCLGANRRGEPFSCMVRPLTGRAHEFDLTPVSSPKKIIVIGGGLVGAETADYLAVYGGRKVTILEMKPAIVADGEPNHFLLFTSSMMF